MTRDSAGSRSRKTPVVAAVFSPDTLIGYEEAKVVTDVGPEVERPDVGDPCIAYWQGNDAVIPLQARVAGDVYCGGKLTVDGTVDGDVFAAKTIRVSGDVSGHRNDLTESGPVAIPGLSPADFDSHYHLGRGVHQVYVIDMMVLRDVRLQPTAVNPGGISCCRGVLRLKGHVKINGMLVVKHDLILEDQCDVVIEAVKNFPALLVGHDVKMSGEDQHLRIEGLAQVGHSINMGHGAGNTIEIIGALCMVAGGVEETAGCVLTINVAPNKAAIEVWRSPQTPERWSPAGGAFFKHIERL